MPYDIISDLPASVKDNLPAHAQEIFLAAFNSAFKEYGKEETAFKVAWLAVEKSYEKVDGKWQQIKNSEHIFYYTNIGAIVNSIHDATLQSLNQWVGGYFLNSGAFNAKDWDGIPIVYQKQGIHPDCVELATNPTVTMDKISGKIVGIIKNAKIEVNGHPRLLAQLEINDPEIEQLISSKKLGLSTGMFGMNKGNHVTSTRPNHVLLFEEGQHPQGNAMPVDMGAIILNSTGGNMPDTKPTKEDMDKMLEFMKENPGSMDKGTMDKMYSAMDAGGKKEYMKSMLKDLNEHPEMMDDEMKGMMSNMKVIKNSIMKEIEDKMAEDKTTEAEKQVQILNSQLEVKAKETAALEARIKDFEAEKLVQIKNTRDAQWKQIKNSIPPGLTHDPAKEQELQAKFMGDPFAFSVFLASQIKPVTTPAEGVEHPILNSEGKPAREDQKVTVGGAYVIGA